MRIEWTEVALDDLAAIRDYIARDSPYYARRFIEHILESVEALENHPQMGRNVPEAGRQDVRELILRGYRVIYQLFDDRVHILTIVHGSRSLTERQNKPWDLA